MSAALELDGVHKAFAQAPAVDGLSFVVRPGTIFGLLGRNGAGKTTTLRMIAGVFYPDSGRIDVFGRPWDAAVRERIAYLPEERGLYKKMRVLDQVVFFAEIKGKRRRAAREAAETALRRFTLWDDRLRRVEELSKGNQQKVQLAAVLVADPELLLLDEPMSGLDPVNVVLVREVLLEERRRGKTIVLSTHMMSEAEKLCDAVSIIHRGRVVLAGTVGGVRASRGVEAVHVELDGDDGGTRSHFADLPGVERAEISGRKAELLIRAGTDTNEILRALVARARVLRFEVASPSLEEIFVERVGRPTEASA